MKRKVYLFEKKKKNKTESFIYLKESNIIKQKVLFSLKENIMIKKY